MRTYYDRYLRAEGRSQSYREEKAHPEEVTPSGPRRCALYDAVEDEDRRLLERSAGRLLYVIDRAHVFGKGAYPRMRYLVDNVVFLNRFSHRCLDTDCDPRDGKSTTAGAVEAWWRLIVGDERYERLAELSRQRP